MDDSKKVLIGIPVGQPISLGRDKSAYKQFRAVACSALIGVTTLLGLLGCIAALSSSRKDEEAGYRLLRVAKVSGDVAKSVCNC